MAEPVDFPGVNCTFVGAGSAVGDLPVFKNEGIIVSMWALTPDEMAEVARTGIVCLGVLGGQLPPVVVGSVEVVRAFTADFGSVWRDV